MLAYHEIGLNEFVQRNQLMIKIPRRLWYTSVILFFFYLGMLHI